MLPTLSNRTLYLSGAILCVIAAWCTIGYHHPDEHFQIWEFANYKLGHIPAAALPWEFPEQMRPGLQPFMAFCTVKICRMLGLDDPFFQVFLLRLACGLTALTLYWRWCNWLEKDFVKPESVRWMRYGLLFFWLMPYLNVRFSSENTAAISFFGGLLLLLKALEHRRSEGFSFQTVLAGLLLGLSFFFRYQMAFAAAGLGVWLLWRSGMGWKGWAGMITGAVLAFILGLGADYWLYETWVCAPYNYFFSNIVEGKAAGFGVEPFWWYATEMPIALIPPLSLLMMLMFALGVRHQPMHVLSWCVVPFILAHSVVGHKEIRFMFPMVLPFFFLAAIGWERYRERVLSRGWMLKTLKVLLVLNAIVLLIRMGVPAKEMAAYNRFIWHWWKEHPESVVHFVKKAPQKNYPLNMPFYEPSGLRQRPWYTDPTWQNDTTALHAGDLMFFTEVLSPAPAPPPGFTMKRVFAYYPDWLLYFNLNDWQSRTRIWSVYRLEKP